MSWVYIRDQSEPLWTVGFYDPAGKWHSDSDHDDRDKAAARVNYLNGGGSPKLLEMLQRIYEAEFGYGAWPTSEEIKALISNSGG
jgi:hypothetical protein